MNGSGSSTTRMPICACCGKSFPHPPASSADGRPTMSTDHTAYQSLHHPDRRGWRCTMARIVWAGAVAMCIAAAPAGATGAGSVQLLATHTSVQYGWAQVELWQDTYS